MNKEKRVEFFGICITLLTLFQGVLLFYGESLGGEVNKQQYDNLIAGEEINNKLIKASMYLNMAYGSNNEIYTNRSAGYISESNTRQEDILTSNRKLLELQEKEGQVTLWTHLINGILLIVALYSLYLITENKHKSKKSEFKTA